MIANKHIRLSDNSSKTSLNKIPAQTQKIVYTFLDDKSAHHFTQICNKFSVLFKNDLEQRAIHQLLQAIIDDDSNMISKVLDRRPELLLIEPAGVNVKDVVSKKTWLRFITEKPFVMAKKLQRVEIIKNIYPYFNKINQIEKRQISDQLLPLVIKDAKSDHDLRKKYIETYFQPLINSILQDQCTFMVTWKLETISAINKFRENLLPKKAVDLNTYFDIDQLLIAAYITYSLNYDKFENDNQRGVFFIQVIGFVQSLVSPDLAKAYCESLTLVSYNKNIITAGYAKLYQMKDTTPFYRTSRESQIGLGYKFFCTADGYIVEDCLSSIEKHGKLKKACEWSLSKEGCKIVLDRLERYVKQKREDLSALQCLMQPVCEGNLHPAKNR